MDRSLCPEVRPQEGTGYQVVGPLEGAFGVPSCLMPIEHREVSIVIQGVENTDVCLGKTN